MNSQILKKLKKTLSSNYILAIIISIVLVVFAIIAYTCIKSAIINLYAENLKEIASHNCELINSELEKKWQAMDVISENIKLWSTDDYFKNSSWKKLVTEKNILKNQKILIWNADTICFVANDGTIYSSDGTSQKRDDILNICDSYNDDFVIRYLHTNTNTAKQEDSLLFGHPVWGLEIDGNHINHIVCTISMKIFSEELGNKLHNENEINSIMDKEGCCILNLSGALKTSSGDDFFAYIKKGSLKNFSSLTKFKSMLFSSKKDIMARAVLNNTGTGNEEYMIVVTPMKYIDWFFVTMVPTSLYEKQSTSVMDIAEILFGLIIVFVLFTTFFMFKQHEQNAKLKAADSENEAKTKYLFNLSHDIRTPMNSIIGYIELAEKHLNSPDRAKQDLEKIKVSGNHLLSLINEVLEMSRIESGKVEITYKKADLLHIKENLTPVIQSMSAQKKIELSIIYGKINNRYVYIDFAHMNQVLLNVLSNAFKYTPEGGEVRYKINELPCTKPNYATFSFIIEDTGIGITPELQQHIFEPFSRNQTSTSDLTEGSGLGLSIAKRLLDLMNGEITVESEPGRGSRFTITISFQIADDPAKQDAIQTKLSKATELHNKKILVVEDNDLNREIIIDLLTEEGASVAEATNGKEAINIIKEKNAGYFDFVLMDIQMPVMNGYEAAKAIRKIKGKGEKLPIIAVSANVFDEDKKKSLESGMNAHIAKPIKIEELIGCLKGFIFLD